MERLRLPHKLQRILIIKPSSLGDVVHSLPFLNLIHEQFPAAEIQWVIADVNAGLLRGNPLIKRLWVISMESWKQPERIFGTISEISLLVRELRQQKFDLVIDLQGLLRSGLMAAATGAPYRVGFREAREGSTIFYTHKIEGGSNIHAIERYLKIAAALGCKDMNLKYPMPPAADAASIAELKKSLGKYAVIVPGARWESKRWPAERFAELAADLSIKSVVVGGFSDRDIAWQISALSEGNAVSMAGKTGISDLLSLMRGASYVITNDSGPMHIAVACGIPVVAIFGPTDPVLTGPYGGNSIVVSAKAECAPCRNRECDDMRCMEDITVEAVQTAIGKLMRKARKRPVSEKSAPPKKAPKVPKSKPKVEPKKKIAVKETKKVIKAGSAKGSAPKPRALPVKAAAKKKKKVSR